MGGHKAADVLEHSGLLQIDVDHVDDVASLRDRIANDRHVVAAWISPSGMGVKAIMRIQPGVESHKATFKAATEYFREIYDVAIDEKCSDVGRLCFVSYDPDIIINPVAEPLEVQLERAEKATSQSDLRPATFAKMQNLLERARAYVVTIPPAVSGQSGHDVTFKVAVALVIGFKLSIEEAYPLLAAWNEHCEPPWNERELRHKLNSALTTSTKKPGFLINERPNTDVASQIQPLWQYSKNDLGYAEALVDFIKGRAVYCPEIQKWLIFGHRWERDGSQQINAMASDLSRHALQEAIGVQDNNVRTEAVKRALNIGNLKTMQNAIALAATDLKVIVHVSQLDTDPWLLGVENGVLNLMTGQLLQGSNDLFVTRSAGTSFDPHATCPTWERFIERVTRGHEGLAGFIQRSVGYSLTAQTVEHFFWFLHGCGRNGKSTFIETLQSLSGEYGTRSSEKLLAMSKHGGDASLDEVAGLQGSRLLFGSETQDGVRLNEKFVKDLTGGDTVRGRHLYHGGFQFRPTCKLWMFGNHRPDICGTDFGIWRRVLMIPFTATITEEELDKHLPAKLYAELPGILNWGISGLQQWRKTGLDAPHCVTSATAEYRSDQDILGDFIKEKVFRTAGVATPKTAMFISYQRWANERGHRSPLSTKRFSRHLKDRGFTELPSRMWAECLIGPL